MIQRIITSLLNVATAALAVHWVYGGDEWAGNCTKFITWLGAVFALLIMLFPKDACREIAGTLTTPKHFAHICDAVRVGALVIGGHFLYGSLAMFELVSSAYLYDLRGKSEKPKSNAE